MLNLDEFTDEELESFLQSATRAGHMSKIITYKNELNKRKEKRNA